MADLKTFVKNVVEEILKTKYPYMLHPAIAVGEVVSAVPAEEGYVYTVRVLQSDGEADNAYPEIPNVWSDVKYDVGSHIAVAFFDGTTKLYVMGRVII